MVRLRKILYRMPAWLFLASTVSSCSYNDGIPGDDGTRGKSMSFRFTIFTDCDNDITRAAGVWDENAANAAERILNIDDIRVLFFDQNGTLLKSLTPASLDYTGNGTLNDGYYSLAVAFTHEYFDKFDDGADIPFTVMILANLNGIGGTYTYYTPGRTRIGDIADSFHMSPTYYPDESTGIPIYGIKGFVTPKSLLTQGIDAAPAGQIDLIRSLCKIEIADRIANATEYPDGQTYPMVTEVEMISWTDHGYIRPLFDDYAQGLRYANIYPASPVHSEVTAKDTDGIFRFYCPEARTADMGFRVTAMLSPDSSPTTYEISLDRFTAAIGTELVRNHIYRFDIHALNTIADLTAGVSDWKPHRHEFELEDIVSVEPDGFLKWTFDPHEFSVSEESYNGTSEMQLSILNGTEAYASGSFHILSPAGSIWRACLIPGENGVDAFEFVDVDPLGNVVPGSASMYVQGEVGIPATIHLRGKGEADPWRHWAELVIEIRTPDGNVLYAPLTSDMSSRFIIYRENIF